MSTARTQIGRLVVATLVALGVLTGGATTATAATTAYTAAATTAGSEPAPQSSGSCNWEKPGEVQAPVAQYESAMLGVQASFFIAATAEPEGSIALNVKYVDSLGRTKLYNRVFVRPVPAQSVLLPGDGRGLTNIVGVYAWATGDPTGVSCGFGVSASPEPLTDPEKRCFESTAGTDRTMSFDYGAPQGGVEVRVATETRLTEAGIAFHAWMTNPRGDRAFVDSEALAPWEVHPPTTIVLPRDGRGTYNVVRAEFRMVTPRWWDVLRCVPSFHTAGAVSEVESRCFLGNVVELAIPSGGGRVEGQLVLEQRPANAGISIESKAYRQDGSRVRDGFSAGGASGLPLTIFRFPRNGTVVTDPARWTIQASSVQWHSLLACRPSVQPA